MLLNLIGNLYVNTYSLIIYLEPLQFEISYKVLQTYSLIIYLEPLQFEISYNLQGITNFIWLRLSEI